MTAFDARHLSSGALRHLPILQEDVETEAREILENGTPGDLFALVPRIAALPDVKVDEIRLRAVEKWKAKAFPVASFDRDIRQARANSPNAEGKPAAKVVRESQATKLLKLLTDVDLFHSPDGRPYLSFKSSGHRETHPIRSRQCRLYLAQRFYDQVGHALSGKALADAVGVLEAEAIFQGAQHPIYCRIGQHDESLYLDLGTPDWTAVEIRPGDGWSILTDPPVRFRRPRGMMAMPRPTAEGDGGAALRRFVNTDPDGADLELIIAWLLAAYRPQGPFPVLVLNSQQGSGKTTTSKVLRLLVDPNEAPVRSQPRDEADLMIAASNSWLIALDNLSHVPDWLSDALCRIATGGAFAKRELYSDDDEVLLNAQRPCILNGIEEIATRGDLVDRSIIVELPKIPDDRRRTEREFWSDFDAQRPAILGWLLTVVSGALARVGTTVLGAVPRMADFAQWAAAAEEPLAWEPGTFINAYRGNRKQANSLTIEAAPIGRHLLQLVALQGSWSGTAAELIDRLNRASSEQERKSRAWPQSPRGLTNAVRRLLPALAAEGLEVAFTRNGHIGERTITFNQVAGGEQ